MENDNQKVVTTHLKEIRLWDNEKETFIKGELILEDKDERRETNPHLFYLGAG
ncbi:MAG: hypothetical protein GX941_03285 [Candidatus Methanofastidiosa archaeon]|nr:hypothetical protein [Candidatus Methanofastidiosa archaeon]